MSGPDKIWVFGAFPSGHYLYELPLRLHARDVPTATACACDSPSSRYGDPQVEGERTRPRGGIGHLAGYSLVTWWDRQGDARRGSHTGILAKGEWTDAQLVAAGRRLAPWAFRVTLGSWADDGGRS